MVQYSTGTNLSVLEKHFDLQSKPKHQQNWSHEGLLRNFILVWILEMPSVMKTRPTSKIKNKCVCVSHHVVHWSLLTACPGRSVWPFQWQTHWLAFTHRPSWRYIPLGQRHPGERHNLCLNQCFRWKLMSNYLSSKNKHRHCCNADGLWHFFVLQNDLTECICVCTDCVYREYIQTSCIIVINRLTGRFQNIISASNNFIIAAEVTQTYKRGIIMYLLFYEQ